MSTINNKPKLTCGVAKMNLGFFTYTFKVRYAENDKVKTATIAKDIPMQYVEDCPLDDPAFRNYTYDVIIDPDEEGKIEAVKQEIKEDFEEFGFLNVSVTR